MSDPELERETPCPSDLMSASLASFNTELGVAEF